MPSILTTAETRFDVILRIAIGRSMILMLKAYVPPYWLAYQPLCHQTHTEAKSVQTAGRSGPVKEKLKTFLPAGMINPLESSTYPVAESRIAMSVE